MFKKKIKLLFLEGKKHRKYKEKKNVQNAA